jgi:hypothetical protein
MKTLQLRSFWVVLVTSLGLTVVGLNAAASATPSVESHRSGLKAEQGGDYGAVKAAGPENDGLRSIVDEEEIPAFLRTDPCDTKD